MSGKKVVGVVIFKEVDFKIVYLMVDGIRDDKQHSPPKGQFYENEANNWDNFEVLKSWALRHTENKTGYTPEHLHILKKMTSFRQIMQNADACKETVYFLAKLKEGVELSDEVKAKARNMEWLVKEEAKEKYAEGSFDTVGFKQMLDEFETFIVAQN